LVGCRHKCDFRDTGLSFGRWLLCHFASGLINNENARGKGKQFATILLLFDAGRTRVTTESSIALFCLKAGFHFRRPYQSRPWHNGFLSIIAHQQPRALASMYWSTTHTKIITVCGSMHHAECVPFFVAHHVIIVTTLKEWKKTDQECITRKDSAVPGQLRPIPLCQHVYEKGILKPGTILFFDQFTITILWFCPHGYQRCGFVDCTYWAPTMIAILRQKPLCAIGSIGKPLEIICDSPIHFPMNDDKAYDVNTDHDAQTGWSCGRRWWRSIWALGW